MIRARAPARDRPARPVAHPAAAGGGHLHRRGVVRHQRVRRLPLGVRHRPRAGRSTPRFPIPTLELVPPPGSDPQGNPDAESAIDTIAHEMVEAMTDPEGAGWMDPNGFEVGDRCEIGPADRHAARLRAGRLAVQPADRRPRVPRPGDVVQPRPRAASTDRGAVDPPVSLPAVTLTQYRATITGRDPSGLGGRRRQRAAAARRASVAVGAGPHRRRRRLAA